MTRSSSGARSLLLVVVLGALGAFAFVFWQGSSGPALRVGEIAPALDLQRIDGEAISLEKLRGRVVFVNFWATWCPPCRKETPSMQRLYQKLREEPFEMLAISIDSPDAESAVRDFRDEFGLGFPILMDSDKSVYNSYHAYGVPESFLLDAQGRLVERFIGPKDWDDPRYLRAIRRLTQESAGAANPQTPSPEVGDG